MDNIDVALAFDPIAEAERGFGGIHWSQFSEDEQIVSVGLTILHNQNKGKLLKESNDTRFGMSWDEFVKIVTTNGFKLGYEEMFPYEDHEEKAAIYYHEDGLILWVTSWNKVSSVNGGEVYGEIILNSAEECWNIPSCSNGFYDLDLLKLHFNKDIREGLIHSLSKLRQCGTFIPIWEEPNKFLWFLNYGKEEKNTNDYKEISIKKMQMFSDETKKIVSRYIE